jgi:hypothetical protein
MEWRYFGNRGHLAADIIHLGGAIFSSAFRIKKAYLLPKLHFTASNHYPPTGLRCVIDQFTMVLALKPTSMNENE